MLIFFYSIWSNVLLINHERVNEVFMLVWEICIELIAAYFVFLQF